MSEQSGSWQPDPFGRHEYRFWDGSQWTDQVANEGVTSVDPPVASAGASAGSEPAASEPAASDPAPTMAETPASEATGPPPAEPQGWAAPDATTAMAAAPPPAAAPGAPGGPGVPPEPTPTGGGGGSSNLPGIIVGVVLLALVLGAAAWFLFLRDDDSDARATVVSGLRDEFGLTSAQANCIADELDDRLDLDQLARDIEADNDPTGVQLIAIFDAFDACNVDPSTLNGDDTTDTTTATTDSDDDNGASGPGTSIPSAMLDLIAQGIMEESGLSQQQARCFAEQIFTLDGIDFGSIMSDPDSFGDDVMNDPDMIFSFFEIFERCDIDPLEFDGGFDGGGSGFQPGTSYGDNPTLDRLWDACDSGDGAACDELYFTSEIGSDYEEFGDTCGGRFPGGTVLCANENLN